jgi:transmembrane sensor
MNDFDRLGSRIAHEQDEYRARSSGKDQVRERLERTIMLPARPWARRIGVTATLIAAVLALAGVAFVVRSRKGAEPLRVMAGRGGDVAPLGSFIEAPENDLLSLRFSDGTAIDMSPRSRARLAQIDARGAHLLLESGGAHVEVVHRPAASWLLSVGPFAVHVTGTRFDVRFDPEEDLFELTMLEGQVDVSGCVFGEGRHLSSGQTARASCKRAELQLIDRRGDTASIAHPSMPGLEDPGPPAPGAAAPMPRPAARSAAADRLPGFRELAEQGKYVEAFGLAEAAGFEAQCARAGADELTMLADAARYAKNVKMEAFALQAVRRRFPGTSRAALSAFALGRLEFDVHGAYRKAAEWFRTYLREQPGGPLTREARGRLLEATHRAGDATAARELAAQYLREYPSGPHADLAREVRASSDR